MKIILGQPYSFCQKGGRSNQEDARFPDCDKPEHYAPFFVVCDGVGGQDKGEVASRTVCDAFAKSLSKTDWNKGFTAEQFRKMLDAGYNALNRVMDTASQEMATTMTFVCFHKNGATVAHIGDSRIYHVRPDVGILYRSDDHSLVNALVHSGNIIPEEAENHPQSNYITRSMGYVTDDEERSCATLLEIKDIEAGDYFLLCTDGVLHQLDDEHIADILDKQDLSDEDKIGKIATLSKDSTDNNTAYLIPIKDVELEDESGQSQEEVYGRKTTILPRISNEAVEIQSKQKNTIRNKVSDILKKIF